MNTYPKITVVTPCFNMVNSIEETILSVLNQNYPNLEYIIIDGGSEDGSVKVIEKYKQQLAYFVSEKDTGMYHALQKGFDKSSGEIMCWINSDDFFVRGSLFAVASVFTHYQQCNWIQGLNSITDETSILKEIVVPYNVSRFSFLNKQHLDKNNKIKRFGTIQQESCFWRRTLWEKAGGKLDLSFKVAADFELWMRFFRYEPMFLVNSAFGVFRQSENQKSVQSAELYINESIEICNRELSLLSLNDRKIYNRLRRIQLLPILKTIPKFRNFYKHYAGAVTLTVK